MKIGIIQTRGLGDVIIAVPIAMYFARRGDSVYWPVDSRSHSALASAFPQVNFIPVDIAVHGENTYDYFLGFPQRALQKAGCEQIHTLYAHLTGQELGHDNFRNGMKFDEYKYGVAGVPFREKWNFDPVRSLERERSLFLKVRQDSARPFILCHLDASTYQLQLQFPQEITDAFDIVNIQPITDNIFDWITTITLAHHVFTIDSCFANLVEQMDLNKNKTFIFKNHRVASTPTLMNHWHFI